MFEQSVVQARALAERPWTMAVSVAAQGFLISAAVVMPLLHPDALQRAAFWIPVAGPPRQYRAPEPAKLDVARSKASRPVFQTAGLIAPARVPQEVHLIQDDPGPAISGGASGLCEGCVVGGSGSDGPAAPILAEIARIKVPPPPAPVQPPPKESPAATKISRIIVGGNVQEAKLIFAPHPFYPPLARQARISGTVHLSALIGPDGKIANLRATSGHPLLIGAAMDAVKRWVYRPTLLNGDPVEVVTEIVVTFTLN